MGERKQNKFEIIEDGKTVKIELTQGQFGYCDFEDWNELKQFKWYSNKAPNCYYIRAELRNSKHQHIEMHQMIMGKSDLHDINHKDHNGLNCRRNNLEFATYQQNAAYALKRRDNKSGFKGVGWRSDLKLWRARITVFRKIIHLGHFENIIDAAKAYNEAAVKYFGKFAVLNVIPEENNYMEKQA